MKILDATCGYKGMWYQKNHPFVTYLDKRNGKYTHWLRSQARRNDVVTISPDIVADWTQILPFTDNYFDMVLFDPPHFIKPKEEDNTMINRYGYLPTDNWKQILKLGITELFRILKPEGVFILKWAETQKKIDEVLCLFPYKPIFGSQNNKSKTCRNGGQSMC